MSEFIEPAKTLNGIPLSVGQAMTLRVEPCTVGLLTYFLLSGLILAFSYTLGDDLLTKHERDCHAKNAALLERQAQGPLEGCS